MALTGMFADGGRNLLESERSTDRDRVADEVGRLVREWQRLSSKAGPQLIVLRESKEKAEYTKRFVAWCEDSAAFWVKYGVR